MTPAIRFLLVFAILHLVFATVPGIDLAVSRWFYTPGEGFLANTSDGWQALRLVFWRLSMLPLLLALIALGVALVMRLPQRISPRVWGFVLSLYVLAPGLLVNVILKDNWGRARPATLAEFGGTHEFTPPFEIASECTRNCSFVSGEAAGAAAFALAIGFVFHGHIARRWRWAVWTGLASFVAGAAVLRVAMGRHFLSDVVFADLMTLGCAMLLARAFGLAAVRASATLPNLRADLGAAAGRVAAALRKLARRLRGA